MRRRLPGLIAALVLAAPVLVGVGYSLLASLGLTGVGRGSVPATERLARVLRDPVVWEGVAVSLWIAAASTLLATAAAVALSLAFRSGGRVDRSARALAVLPLPLPHLVAAVTALLVLGQSGLLSRVGFALGLVASPAGMPALVYDPLALGVILALVWKEVPFLAMVAFSVLAGRVAALEEVARGLGAGRAAVIRRVTLPILLRGLLPAAVAVFAFAFGSYEVAALLAPSDPLPLPLLTAERYTDASLAARGDAFVLVLLSLGVAGVAVAAHEVVRRGWEGVEG